MDLLSDVLTQLRLVGTLYFRTSFTSPWGVQVPSYRHVARFHYAHKGRCLVRVEGDESPIDLNQGDLVIIPKGSAHTLYCDPSTEADALPLEKIIETSGFAGHGTLVYGEPGTHHETQLVCGHFAFDEACNHPLIDALPKNIHIKDYGATAGTFMESTLRVIGSEAGTDLLGSGLIALKLSEIIFAQALRSYLVTDGRNHPGLAGFADSKISTALKALHDDPAHPWKIEDMAEMASMSRTAFMKRFTDKIGMTPMSYLTGWRMQLARRVLETEESAIIEVAVRAGYQSEAAFGRAFKKHFDIAPATFRKQAKSGITTQD